MIDEVTASPTGATTSVLTTAGSGGSSIDSPDRECRSSAAPRRERSSRQRRRRPTRRGAHHVPRAVAARRPGAQHGPTRPPGRATGVAGRDHPRPRRLGDRLLPHGARRPERRRLADSKGVAATAYYGDLGDELRVEAEHKLQTNELKVLVATTALGMGYDKPDLSFVIHFQSPGSPVAYYQQVGRAGRALERSRGVLLTGPRGRGHPELLHRARLRRRPHRQRRAARRSSGSTVRSLLLRVQNTVNVSWGSLELVLKQLDVDGVSAADRRPDVRTHAAAVGLPHRTGRAGHRRPPSRATGDDRLLHDRGLPDAIPGQPARRPGRRTVRTVRQLPGRERFPRAPNRARCRGGAIPPRATDRDSRPRRCTSTKPPTPAASCRYPSNSRTGGRWRSGATPDGVS